MNPDQLLAGFDRIADAPGAVERLRRFVLDLAVRGRLVEQNEGDEPAETLIDLIKNRYGRRKPEGKNNENIQMKFLIPKNWAWVLMGRIYLNSLYGPRFGKNEYSEQGTPTIRTTDMADSGIVELKNPPMVTFSNEKKKNKYLLKNDDLLLTRSGTIGRMAIFKGSYEAIPSAYLIRFRFPQEINSKYIYCLLKSSYGQELLGLNIRSIGVPNVNANSISKFPIPLPPLPEQHRIVAKVDELMALCDELEMAQTRRENRRNRLVAATLHGMNNGGEGGDFRESARFYFNHLPRLATRPEHIQQLRQTILNLAVRGRLVEQDEGEKPFQGIKAIDLQGDEMPFKIPKNWKWVFLKELGEIIGGGTPSKNNYEYWEGAIPWIAPKNMKQDYIRHGTHTISQKALDESSAKLIPEGSVLFVVRGMILAHSFPVAIAQSDLAVNQDMKAIALIFPDMAEYVLRALKGMKEIVLLNVERSSHGTCRLPSSFYKLLPFPVPPLAEQHRIVAKVDELMTLCDQLESRLTQNQTTAQRLLESTLHAALNGSPPPAPPS
jgi:type I restriction enzyme S subunit